MGFLEAIVAQKRAEVAAAKMERPEPAVYRPTRDFASALRRPGLSFITEIKRRSPSKGVLRADLDAAAQAQLYERAGAAAVSCLTDREFFGARPDDLPRASAAVAIPILRKDFVIDDWQIRESLRIGADAVLLIVRILSPNQLADYMRLCRELALGALVEVHNDAELDAALAAGAKMIGINNRDLDTFTVSLATSLRLRPRILPGTIVVAESGIATRADVTALEQSGFDAVLMGESLVTSADPAALIAELRGDR